MSVTKVGQIKALWREGWIKIPEVMASSGLALVSMCLATGCYFYKDRKHGWTEKYKQRYVVVRPDDPRAKNIQTYSSFDY